MNGNVIFDLLGTRYALLAVGTVSTSDPVNWQDEVAEQPLQRAR